jgi:DNA-binding transcriptional ArsR family regulator
MPTGLTRPKIKTPRRSFIPTTESNASPSRDPGAGVTTIAASGINGEAPTHPFPDELVELIAERFHALAEPTRIKLLDRLSEGEATVLELTARAGTTQQNVSKHLGLLQHTGIVARRKQGNFSYYRIVDEGVYSLCETVCGSLKTRYETLRNITSAANQ